MTASDTDNAGHSDLLTVAETAARLGKSERTIRRYISAGRLPTVDLGGRVYIQGAALPVDRRLAGEVVQPGANADRSPGIVSGAEVKVLEDTIRRQDSEIVYLRSELTAARAVLEGVLRILPPARSVPTEGEGAQEQGGDFTGLKSTEDRPFLSRLLPWALIILGGAAVGWLWWAILR